MSAFRRTFGVLLTFAACVSLLAQQTDRTRTEGLARRAGDRLQTLQQEADRLASQERTLLGDLRKFEVEREIKTEELRQIAARAAVSAHDLAAVNQQVQRLERDDLAERPALSARIVELYKLGQGRYLRLLLSTSDVRSIGQASRMVAALAKRDGDRIAAARQRLSDLQASRKVLEARGMELAALRVDAERAQSAANGAVAARNELIRNIDAQRDLNAQLAGELQAAQQKLQLTLRDVNAGANGAALQAPGLPIRPFRGDLDWPVAGTVRQRFGGAGGAGRPTSNGIEIAAADGTAVHSIHDGTVVFADSFAGFGDLVIVDHGGQTLSLYGNLSDIAVTRGAHVDHGQTIGTVGTSPTSPAGAPGLYFELRVDARPVDPLQWLKKK